MVKIKANFEKWDKSDTDTEPKPRNSIIGPVVVMHATANISASSNNIPNIARIIVTRAKLTINNIKKTQAIKTEISGLFMFLSIPAIDEG